MLLHFPFLLFVKINHFCDFCRRKNASVQNVYKFLRNLNDFHTIRKHSFIEEPLKDSQNIKAIRYRFDSQQRFLWKPTLYLKKHYFLICYKVIIRFTSLICTLPLVPQYAWSSKISLNYIHGLIFRFSIILDGVL